MQPCKEVDPLEEDQLPAPTRRILQVRAGFLFLNFFLIILALYQLKPASRSLYLQFLGAERLPYVWIGTALVMGLLIAWYNRLVGRYSRLGVVAGSCLLFAGLLVIFRVLFESPHPATAIAFYIFVDILGVVLVEQFWSLTNAIYSTREGKNWYGLIGTGGLVGGVVGGGAAALILKYTRLQTPDLLLGAALSILLALALTWWMGRLGIYQGVAYRESPPRPSTDWGALRQNRYLLLIAAILLLSQLVDPIVEYQFLTMVESHYPEMEARTTYLSGFFSVLGLVSIAVNLGLTPLIHRFLGAIAGLLVQPLALGACSLGFFVHPTLMTGAVIKISDRGLSYSINRASKELLYVPINSVLIYQAKAWIDMFGYRLFKIFGAIAILAFTRWLPLNVSVPHLSWLTIAICLLWVGLVGAIWREYARLA